MKFKGIKKFLLIVFATVMIAFSSCSVKRGGVSKHPKSHTQISIKGLTGDRKRIVEKSMEWLGTPYAYGKSEKGKGCDCSGMVLAVYLEATGKKLPRNSAQQADYSRKLNKRDVKPGDLVFFATGKDPNKISHVGIMLDDEQFIHASTSKGVVISNVTTPYYIRTFKKYGRIL